MKRLTIVINSLMPSGIGIQSVGEERFADAVDHNRDVARVLEDEYGWSEEDIRGFLGENLVRV